MALRKIVTLFIIVSSVLMRCAFTASVDAAPRQSGLEKYAAIKTPHLWNSPDLDWINWVVVNTQPGTIQHGAVWTDAERLKFIEDFDPDVLDWWSGLLMNRGDLARMRGIASDGGIEYEYEAPLLGVKYLDAEIFAGNGPGVKENGSYPMDGYGDRQMTHLAPKWHETVKSGNVRYSVYGDMVCQDNLIHGIHYAYGQFDDWTNRRFIEYIKENFSLEELISLGFPFTPEKFHIRKYLADKRRIMNNEQLIEDPIIHEYIRMHYIASIASVVDIHEQVKQTGFKAGRAVPVFYGNLAGMTDDRSFGLSLSEHVDVVWIEDGVSSQLCHSEKLQAKSSLIYKIGRAAGHFTKPVWTTLSFPHSNKRMTNAVTLAEGHANGGMLMAASHIGKKEGPKLDTHRRHCRFVGRNRIFFIDRERLAEVAVVNSVPSLFWRWFSSLEVERPHLEHLAASARLLEDRHIPYEVMMFGHPDVYDDTDHLARLYKYKTVIIPNADCISVRQAKAVSTWVRRGGKLILWGEVGTRNEEMLRRSKPVFSDLVSNSGKGQVINVGDSKYGPMVHPRNGSVQELHEAYRDKMPGAEEKIAELIIQEKPVIETDLPVSTWVNVWLHGAGPMVSVQMVNYNINPESDTVTPVQNFTLRLRVPPGVKYEQAHYFHAGYETGYAVDGDHHKLTLTQKEDYVEVVVPQLRVFGVVAFTSIGELESRTAAAQARKWYERLKIASHCPGQDVNNYKTIADEAKKQLSQIQGKVKVKDFKALTGPLNRLTGQLKKHVEEITTEVSSLKEDIRNKALEVEAEYKFDFGESGAAEGWTEVTINSKYLPEQGYGWTALGEAIAFDTAEPDLLHRDYIRARDPTEYITGKPNKWFPVVTPPENEAQFRVDLANGDYIVTVIVGDYDEYYHHSRVGVTYVDAEGEPMLYGDRLYSDYYQNRAFRIKITDGSLDLRFWGRNVGPLYFNSCDWLVNGLIIQKAEKDLTPKAKEYLTQAELRSASAIRDWYIVGPFDDDDCTGLDSIFGPEKDTDLNGQYKGKNGDIRGQQLAPLKGLAPYVSLSGVFDVLDEVAAFAITKVYCKRPTDAMLVASTSQIGKGFVNGKEVFRDEYCAGLLPHEERVPIQLNKGWNTILIKSLNHFGDEWSLWAGLETLDGNPLKNADSVVISASSK